MALTDDRTGVTSLQIDRRQVGPGHPCLLIAEVAQAHDGSLGIAHSYVDAVAAQGADAIKFQTHIAAAESTPGEPFRVKFSRQDASRYDYWRRMEFSPSQWRELADHCRDAGLLFLSSPFSIEAVELLTDVGMCAWKVGSGEVNNPLMLDAMAATRQPILLSTGMSDWQEIARAVQQVRATDTPLALLQCTSRYPTTLDQVGLNVVAELRERFDAPAGLSDHSGTPFPALAAMARGADLVECHVVFDRRMFGPDTPASLDLNELRLLAQARDAFHTLATHPVDKDALATELEPMRRLFNKSVALRSPQPAGTRLEPDMLTVKKPGTGIPAESLKACIGRRLAVQVGNDRVLEWQDLEDEA